MTPCGPMMSGALLERVSKEATAYLHHLVEKYDDLAVETSLFSSLAFKKAWTFFLHADAPEHVHPFRLLEEVPVRLKRSELPSKNLRSFLAASSYFLALAHLSFSYLISKTGAVCRPQWGASSGDISLLVSEPGAQRP